MEQIQNAVIVQGATLADIEAIVDRAVEKRISAFYEAVRKKPSPLIKRKDAAQMLDVSLPTLDAYARAKIIHARHVGGRVFYSEEELLSFAGHRRKAALSFPYSAGEPLTNISPLPSKSHSQDTP